MQKQYTSAEIKILRHLIRWTCFVRLPQATAPGECWVRVSNGTGDGNRTYAQTQVDGRRKAVHSVAYTIMIRPIPESFVLDHLCRIPRCWNPTHLEPVSRGENVLRGVGISAVNAKKTACPRGHLFTPENTLIWWLGEKPRRRCRICHNATMRRYKARKRHG